MEKKAKMRNAARKSVGLPDDEMCVDHEEGVIFEIGGSDVGMVHASLSSLVLWQVGYGSSGRDGYH